MGGCPNPNRLDLSACASSNYFNDVVMKYCIL